jgi:uncharacterized membrane protein YfcA
MESHTEAYLSLFFFFLLTLVAEILGTIGGFGSSLFFVSLSGLFFDFQTVLALTGLLHIFSNTSKLILFRNAINWRLVLTLGVSSLALAIGGAYLTTVVDLHYARLLLGLFLLFFSIFFYLRPEFALRPTIQNSIVGGSFAGFLAGFIGTGGAVRGLVLASFKLEKNLFVGTSAAIDFCVDLSRTIIYLDNDYMTLNIFLYAPILGIASFAGSYLGKQFLQKISQEAFRKILLGMVFLMGALLVGNDLFSSKIG